MQITVTASDKRMPQLPAAAEILILRIYKMRRNPLTLFARMYRAYLVLFTSIGTVKIVCAVCGGFVGLHSHIRLTNKFEYKAILFKTDKNFYFLY